MNNVAINGEVAGFYVGDSPHAKAVLRDNVAKHNGEFGFFLRDSSHARAVHNKAVNNCLGMGLINTGSPGRGPRLDHQAKPRAQEQPQLSGLRGRPADLRHGDRRCSGPAITSIQRNIVNGNRPVWCVGLSGRHRGGLVGRPSAGATRLTT